MKIEKQFVDLIYNGEKEFEFRTSCSTNYSGQYKIKDKIFELEIDDVEFNPSLEQIYLTKDRLEIVYKFCGYTITKQEYEWLERNKDYWVGNVIKIFVWREITFKELEIVGE